MNNKFVYMFTDTNIKELIESNGKNLTQSDLVNLIVTVNYRMIQKQESGKYTKDNQLIYENAYQLPLPETNDFDDMLKDFMLKKPFKQESKPEKQKSPKKEQKKVSSISIKKLLIPTILFISIISLVGGVYIAHASYKASQDRLKQTREYNLAKLEKAKEYDSVADKMKQYGYRKSSIANMYISHNKFSEAINVSSSSLESVLNQIHTLPVDEQKQSLNDVLNTNKLTIAKEKEVKMYLAIVYQDVGYIKGHIDDVNNTKLSKYIVRYLITRNEFTTSETVLKKYPNKSISEDLKNAIKEQISLKDSQLNDLNNQMNDINKGEDKDKDKKKDSKQKEINAKNEEKGALETQLKALK